jgi:hypothetical protein
MKWGHIYPIVKSLMTKVPPFTWKLWQGVISNLYATATGSVTIQLNWICGKDALVYGIVSHSIDMW